MGTPRRKFKVCGIDACGSVRALLDTGADVTLLSRELAERVGALPLREATLMKSTTGQEFQARRAVVLGHLDGDCGGALIVGITDRENLGGEDAIIGNDIMGEKCMKIEFEPEKRGEPQLVRVGCDCQNFFLDSPTSEQSQLL